MSPMSTSPPWHPSYTLKSTTTVIQPPCKAMFQVPAVGRHCSPVPRKVLAVSQGGHHCCSLVRQGQGFWEATQVHGIEDGHNDVTTVIPDKAWNADHYAPDFDRAKSDGSSLQPGEPWLCSFTSFPSPADGRARSLCSLMPRLEAWSSLFPLR